MLTVIVSSLYLFSSGKEKLAQTVAMICWSSSLSSGNDRTICISVFFFSRIQGSGNGEMLKLQVFYFCAPQFVLLL